VGGDGFDIVFDSVGGGDLRKSYRLLAPFGRLGLFGASSFVAHRKFRFFKSLFNLLRFPVFWPLEMMNSTRAVFGLGLLRRPASDPRLRRALAEAARLWREGHLHPVIDSVYPLERIGDAQRRLEERKNFGKVVLAVHPGVPLSIPPA
jgi:NADPH:quinone reductase-like Zn-dependent oxidoreductase